jgi:hypothetical protein
MLLKITVKLSYSFSCSIESEDFLGKNPSPFLSIGSIWSNFLFFLIGIPVSTVLVVVDIGVAVVIGELVSVVSVVVISVVDTDSSVVEDSTSGSISVLEDSTGTVSGLEDSTGGVSGLPDVEEERIVESSVVDAIVDSSSSVSYSGEDVLGNILRAFLADEDLTTFDFTDFIVAFSGVGIVGCGDCSIGEGGTSILEPNNSSGVTPIIHCTNFPPKK